MRMHLHPHFPVRLPAEINPVLKSIHFVISLKVMLYPYLTFLPNSKWMEVSTTPHGLAHKGPVIEYRSEATNDCSTKARQSQFDYSVSAEMRGRARAW